MHFNQVVFKYWHACCSHSNLKISAVVQRVDNYEYELPSDFEDEEIDDEQAFNSEDERMYGHLFKNKQGGDASEEEEDEDEEDDLLHSEDDDEQENISDSEEENDDEEDSELEDVFAKAGAASDGDSPRLFGSDEEEAEEEGDDDEDEYEMKEARREAMVRAVTDGAVCGEGKNITGRRRKKEIVVTEVYPESEFNLPAAGQFSYYSIALTMGAVYFRENIEPIRLLL